MSFVNLSVERTYEYTLSLCTTQQQASSNLQASKQSRSESKNTQRECVFFAKRRRLFTTPKGRVNSQKQYTLWVGIFYEWGIETELNQIVKIDKIDKIDTLSFDKIRVKNIIKIYEFLYIYIIYKYY